MIDLNRIFIPDFPLVVAVSGGVDSMVLLDIVMQKIPKNKIFVAHFNHNLRSLESDGDADFVQDFCQKNNLKFFLSSQKISNLANLEKSSIETTARKYRYEFFQKIFIENNCQFLLTAHHLDDRIETAIFNLIRGAKFGGISALKRQNFYQKMQIFRPLLDFSKSEIIAYAKEKNIFFREDSTNLQTDFHRNFIRHEILPKFCKINPNYQNSLKNFIDFSEKIFEKNSENADFWLENQDKKYFLKKQKIILKNKIFENSKIFSIFDFKKLDFFEQSSILEKIYREKNNGTFGFSDAIIHEILRFLE